MMSAADHMTEGERLLDLATERGEGESARTYAIRAQAHFEAASTLLMAASIVPAIGYDPLKRDQAPSASRMVDLGIFPGEPGYCPGDPS